MEPPEQSPPAADPAVCQNHDQPIVRVPAAPRWRCVAVSAIGVSHAQAQQPLQDAYAYAALDDGAVVVAVADGAGSAPRAEQGATLAVAAVLALAQLRLVDKAAHALQTLADWQGLMHELFEAARGVLEAEAVRQETPLRDYAATLLVLIATPELAACGLIGDCAAVVQLMDGALLSLCPAQKGEYANMTYFLTQDDALEKLDVQLIQEPIQHIAVLTDGLLELALNVAQNRPYAPFFKPLFHFARATPDSDQASAALADFLSSARVNSRTHDDKTLLLLSRVEESGE